MANVNNESEEIGNRFVGPNERITVTDTEYDFLMKAGHIGKGKLEEGKRARSLGPVGKSPTSIEPDDGSSRFGLIGHFVFSSS